MCVYVFVCACVYVCVCVCVCLCDQFPPKQSKGKFYMHEHVNLGVFWIMWFYRLDPFFLVKGQRRDKKRKFFAVHFYLTFRTKHVQLLQRK